MNSDPEDLDNEGINGQIHNRKSQIRWSPRFGEKLKLNIALEDPTTDVLNGQSLRGRPDLVASLDHMPLGGWLRSWNSRIGFILRDLKATESSGSDSEEVMGGSPDENTTGWGITASGRHPLSWWGGKDFLLWQLNYGEGIGNYINDLNAVGGGDAVFDPQGQLRALPVFAGYVSYQHTWPKRWGFLKSWPGFLRSNLTLSWIDINNYQFQEGGDYKSTLEAPMNLMYSPTDSIIVGLEFLWDERKNKDGSKGTATQLQMGARYTF